MKAKIPSFISKNKVLVFGSAMGFGTVGFGTFWNMNQRENATTEKGRSLASKQKRLNIPEHERRLVLIGKTGSGKSSTGNTILKLCDDDKFAVGCDSISVTQQSDWKTRNRFQKKIDVVDTPGIFDESKTNKEIQNEMKRAIGHLTPGPHAILLCVKMDRIAKQDAQMAADFMTFFGEEMKDFLIVVFTHFDLWKGNKAKKGNVNPNSEEYVKNIPQYYQEILEACGQRYVFFCNSSEDGDDEAVTKLIKMIEENTQNGRKHYTDENFKKAEEELQDMSQKLFATSGQTNVQGEDEQVSLRDVVKTSNVYITILKTVITFIGEQLFRFIFDKWTRR